MADPIAGIDPRRTVVPNAAEAPLVGIDPRRSVAAPVGIDPARSLTPAVTPEDADVTGFQQSAGPLRKGLRSGFNNALASVEALAGQTAQALGVREFAATMFEEAKKDANFAMRVGPETRDYRQVKDLGTLSEFVLGHTGSGIASSVPAIAAGLALRRPVAGAVVGSYPQLAGEQVQRLRDDPKVSQDAILGNALGAAIPMAALETFGAPASAVARLLKPTAKGAVKSVGKDILKEGAVETAQDAIGQAAHMGLNPDVAMDPHSLINAGLAGAAGGGGIAAGSQVASLAPGATMDTARFLGKGAGALRERFGRKREPVDIDAEPDEVKNETTVDGIADGLKRAEERIKTEASDLWEKVKDNKVYDKFKDAATGALDPKKRDDFLRTVRKEYDDSRIKGAVDEAGTILGGVKKYVKDKITKPSLMNTKVDVAISDKLAEFLPVDTYARLSAADRKQIAHAMRAIAEDQESTLATGIPRLLEKHFGGRDNFQQAVQAVADMLGVDSTVAKSTFRRAKTDEDKKLTALQDTILANLPEDMVFDKDAREFMTSEFASKMLDWVNTPADPNTDREVIDQINELFGDKADGVLESLDKLRDKQITNDSAFEADEEALSDTGDESWYGDRRMNVYTDDVEKLRTDMKAMQDQYSRKDVQLYLEPEMDEDGESLDNGRFRIAARPPEETGLTDDEFQFIKSQGGRDQAANTGTGDIQVLGDQRSFNTGKDQKGLRKISLVRLTNLMKLSEKAGENRDGPAYIADMFSRGVSKLINSKMANLGIQIDDRMVKVADADGNTIEGALAGFDFPDSTLVAIADGKRYTYGDIKKYLFPPGTEPRRKWNPETKEWEVREEPTTIGKIRAAGDTKEVSAYYDRRRETEAVGTQLDEWAQNMVAEDPTSIDEVVDTFFQLDRNIRALTRLKGDAMRLGFKVDKAKGEAKVKLERSASEYDAQIKGTIEQILEQLGELNLKVPEGYTPSAALLTQISKALEAAERESERLINAEPEFGEPGGNIKVGLAEEKEISGKDSMRAADKPGPRNFEEDTFQPLREVPVAPKVPKGSVGADPTIDFVRGRAKEESEFLRTQLQVLRNDYAKAATPEAKATIAERAQNIKESINRILEEDAVMADLARRIKAEGDAAVAPDPRLTELRTELREADTPEKRSTVLAKVAEIRPITSAQTPAMKEPAAKNLPEPIAREQAKPKVELDEPVSKPRIEVVQKTPPKIGDPVIPASDDKLHPDTKRAEGDAPAIKPPKGWTVDEAKKLGKDVGEALFKALAAKKSAQSASGLFGMTPEEEDAVKVYVTKVLGSDAATKFGKWKHAGAFIQDSTGVETVLISMFALDPQSTAYHETMHAFFARLIDVDKKAAHTLLRAAGSPMVISKLHTLLKDHPDAIKQLTAKGQMELNPKLTPAQAEREAAEERLAYMFQFWKASDDKHNILTLGPNTDTVFGTVQSWFRKIAAVWSDNMGDALAQERANELFSAFDRGEFANRNTVAQVLREKYPGVPFDKVDKMFPGLGRIMDKFVWTATGAVRDLNVPELTRIMDMFHTAQGARNQGPGFLQAKHEEYYRRMNVVNKALEGMDAAQQKTVLDELRSGKAPTSAAAKTIRGVLDEAFEYMKEAGVAVPEKNADGSFGYRVISKVNDNYFPRVYDKDKLLEHRKEFIALLEANKVENPELVFEQLVSRKEHQLPEEDQVIGLTFYTPALNKRTLLTVPEAELSKYMADDLMGIMSEYLARATRRAEYTRRFDNAGEVIAEARKEAKDKHSLTPDQLKTFDEAVKAMEGSLGNDMSESAQRLYTGLMTYQNVRLLPLALFSSLIDPLGIMVRGGGIADATRGFWMGITGLIKTHKGEAAQLAETIGAINAAHDAHEMADLYGSQYMPKGARRINDTFFRWNGMESWNKNMRIAASVAAKKFIERHATDLNEHSTRYLEELNLTKADVEIKNGELVINDKVRQAMNMWIDGAIIRPNAALRPVYMSDPNWMLISHLKQYTYLFQKQIIGRVSNELAHGNYTPAFTLLSYVPTIIAADMLKAALTPGGADDDAMARRTAADWMWHGVQRAGIFGPSQYMLDTVGDGKHNSYIGESLMGPTVQQIAGFIRGAAKGDITEELVRAIPGERLVRN